MSESLRQYTPRAFAWCAILLGVCYAFLIPPFQVADEPAHLDREIAISEGYFISQATTPIPDGVVQMDVAFSMLDKKMWPNQQLHLEDVAAWLERPLGSASGRRPNYNAAIYSWVPYLPASAAVFASRMLHVSPAGMLYSVRLTNLLTFTCLVYFALALAPDFHLLIACIGLMPMTLSQAASCSVDAIAISAAIFFIAYILRLAFDQKVTHLSRTDYAVLICAAIMCAQAKVDIGLLVLLVLIPAAKFGRSARIKWCAVAGIATIGLASLVLWQVCDEANMALFLQFRSTQGVNVALNSSTLRAHPFSLFELLWQTLKDERTFLATMFVGDFGWLAVPLPLKLVAQYLFLLLFLAIFQCWRIRLGLGHRCLLLAVFCLSFVAVFAAMCSAEMRAVNIPAYLRGAGDIPGVQGRYFIPFVLAAGIALSWRRVRLPLGIGLLAISFVAGTTEWRALKDIRHHYWASALWNVQCGTFAQASSNR